MDQSDIFRFSGILVIARLSGSQNWLESWFSLLRLQVLRPVGMEVSCSNALHC